MISVKDVSTENTHMHTLAHSNVTKYSVYEIIQNKFVLVLLFCMAELPYSMEMLHFLVGATVTSG